jgi:hypothetical protein
MMELFQPNNLSRDRPEFVPVNDPVLCAEIESVLADCYGVAERDDLAIGRFAGANISSQNFKVTTGVNRWFLKSRDLDRQAEMANEVSLIVELRDLGQKVPQVVQTTDSAVSAVHSGKCWTLYEFQNGNYFSGKNTELDSAAKEFGRLTRSAKKLARFADKDVDAKEFDFLNDLPTLLDLACSTESAISELCSSHRTNIQKSLELVENNIESLSEHWLPLHLDYHPLNLLLVDGEVQCILDLEHLKNYSALAGSGFAAFKLIRQAMVDESFRELELKFPSAVERWIDATSLPEVNYSGTQLAAGARFRVLKLIHLILNSSLRLGDQRHDYDLNKQIYSLYEIGIIFERA